MDRILKKSLFLTLIAASPAAAQTEWTSGRPDGHAPIGVMGDHTHAAGEFMLSYRFMRMNMDGNRSGTDEVTTQAVLSDFMVSPLRMPMNMHMVGLMYAPSDAVTLMGMVPYITQSMDHETRMGGLFTTESSGIGDVSLSALIGLKREGSTRAHLTLGASAPTGGTDERDVTPMGPDPVRLPYPMQIGSGTFDFRPALTFLGMSRSASWGLQGSAVLSIGENDQAYTWGNAVSGTGWFAIKAGSQLSLSARVLATVQGEIDGADPAYGNLMLAPTVRPDLRGGTRVDVPLGINVHFPDGVLKGHRIGAEWSFPVYQDLDGPQLETDWVLTVGWQKSFEPIGHH